jgi:hypothetical protein
MRRTLVGLLLTFVALVGFSIWFVNKYFWIEAHSVMARVWPPPTVQQVERKELQRIAGRFSLDCGHVRHRQDADTAISCALQALKSGHRFYVAFDYVGLDSHGTTGLALNPEGVLYQVETDQMGGGLAGVVCCSQRISKARTYRCKNPPTEEVMYPANRYLSCIPQDAEGGTQ